MSLTQQYLRKLSCSLYRLGSRFFWTMDMIDRPGCRSKKPRISPSTRSVRSASERLMSVSKDSRRDTSDAIASSRAWTIEKPAHMTWRDRRITYRSGRLTSRDLSAFSSAADIFASM